MSSQKYIPPYKVSGRAMNLITDIAAAIESFSDDPRGGVHKAAGVLSHLGCAVIIRNPICAKGA